MSAAALDGWLKRRRRWVVAAIVAGSVLVRLVYALQLAGGPGLRHHEFDQTDMSFFHQWATAIAAGDWLTSRPAHPFHEWHAIEARRYAEAYPQEAAALALEAQRLGVPPAELLWERLYGGTRFHQEPLYPYLIGATYAVGLDSRAVVAWQMALGVLANVLIYLLARRLAGDTAAAIAGMLAIGCGPLMFYEAVLLRAAPLAAAGLAAAWLTTEALSSDRARWWLAAGAVTGLAILLKSTFLSYLLGVLCILAWTRRREPWALARAAGAVVAGVAIVLAPLAIRNAIVGQGLLSMSSVGWLGFALTNAADWQARTGEFGRATAHLAAIMHDSGGRFGAAVVATMKTHDGVLGPIGQWLARFALVWHWYEVPNNTNVYFDGLHAPILRWMPVRFAVVAPPALVGLVVCARRLRSCWPLYLLVASTLAPLVLFGNLSRYRVVMLAPLVAFAAAAIVAVVGWIGRRRWMPAAAAIAATAALALFMLRPLGEGVHVIRPHDHYAPLEYFFIPRAEAAASAGDFEGAAAVAAEALACEPDFLDGLGADRPAADAYEATLARLYATAHLAYAGYLERTGDAGRAAAERARAEALRRAAEAITEDHAEPPDQP